MVIIDHWWSLLMTSWWSVGLMLMSWIIVGWWSLIWCQIMTSSVININVDNQCWTNIDNDVVGSMLVNCWPCWTNDNVTMLGWVIEQLLMTPMTNDDHWSSRDTTWQLMMMTSMTIRWPCWNNGTWRWQHLTSCWYSIIINDINDDEHDIMTWWHLVDNCCYHCCHIVVNCCWTLLTSLMIIDDHDDHCWHHYSLTHYSLTLLMITTDLICWLLH